MKLDTMTVDEINDLIREKSNEIDAAKAELRAICRVRDAKAEADEVEQLLKKMDPSKRAQVIARAGGVPTSERVGRPGR